MDFVIRLPILINRKDNKYDFILVIIDWLIKIVYHELVKVIIAIASQAKLILDVII